MRQRDINKIQTIIFLRRLVAYLLILKYIRSFMEEAGENGQVNADYIYLGSVPIARVDEWWENMPMPQEPSGLNLIPGDTQLTVNWSASPEPIDGYKVYLGKESGKYTSSTDVGKVTSHTITGLTNGISYYIAVKAYADIKETYFYHTDHLGTPLLMTNGNGTIVWEGELLPFGERYSVKGNVINNIGLPGQYYDIEIKQYYNWWRYYNDELGRYKSFDPILHPANGPPAKASSCGNSAFGSTFDSLLFTPIKLNPFIYVGGNPINYIDPKGLFIYGCGRKPTDPLKAVPECLNAINAKTSDKVEDDCLKCAKRLRPPGDVTSSGIWFVPCVNAWCKMHPGVDTTLCDTYKSQEK